MTPFSVDQFVLDAGPLAQAPCGFDAQRLVLRTAVHCGVRWIWCPDAAAQTLAGRALFDLGRWRAAIPIGPDISGGDALYGAMIRLRRNRIDMAVLSNLSARALLPFQRAQARGDLGDVGAYVPSAPSLIAALRTTRFSHVSLTAEFDPKSWADPVLLTALATRPDATCFAPPAMRHLPGVSGVVFAPVSPRGLIRAFASLNPRLERRAAEGLAAARILAEAA